MSGFTLPDTKPSDTKPSKVDPDALRAFAAGAKSHRTEEPYPWEKFDPEEKPIHNVSVRLNDYELEMLRFLAKHADVSQQKILNRILMPEIKKQVEQLTGE